MIVDDDNEHEWALRNEIAEWFLTDVVKEQQPRNERKI